MSTNPWMGKHPLCSHTKEWCSHMLHHAWTWTHPKLKELKTTRPYATQFHLYEMPRTGKSRHKREHGCQGARGGGQWGFTGHSVGFILVLMRMYWNKMLMVAQHWIYTRWNCLKEEFYGKTTQKRSVPECVSQYLKLRAFLTLMGIDTEQATAGL